MPQTCWLLLILFMLGASPAAAQAQNNPYRSRYPSTACHWTDSLPWQEVLSITDFGQPSQSWGQRLQLAQDEALRRGGAVIHFPAGTYQFSDNLRLKDGVILRGAGSVAPHAHDSAFAPQTRFVFPEYVPTFSGNGTPNTTAFKGIRSAFGASNIGLVGIDVNRAYVRFQPDWRDTTFANGYQTKWPRQQKRNVLVMNCRFNNAAFPAWFWTPQPYQNGWQRYPYHSVANIDVHVVENAVIANNRLNDFQRNSRHPLSNESYPQPGYIVKENDTEEIITYQDGEKVVFDYAAHYGITANRIKVQLDYSEGFVSVPGFWPDGSIKQSPPEEEPTLYAEGMEIRDNWIYKTVRVGIFAAGNGLLIQNNRLRDKQGKQAWASSSGRFTNAYDATLENRGIDYAGWHCRVEGNEVEVFRHQFEDTKFRSIDGEGILVQECCGGTPVRNHTIRHNTIQSEGAYIGIFKTRDIHQLRIDSNRLGGSDIWVFANTNAADFSISDAYIRGNTGVNDIKVNGAKGGNGGLVADNQGSGELEVPAHLRTENNSGFQALPKLPSESQAYPDVALDTAASEVAGDSLRLKLSSDSIPLQQLDFTFFDGLDTLHQWRWQGPTAVVPLGQKKQHFVYAQVANSQGKRSSTRTFAWKRCDSLATGLPARSLEQGSALKVFPNPAAEGFFVKRHQAGPAQLQLFGNQGRLLLQKTIRQRRFFIERQAEWPAGLYGLRIASPKGVHHQKILLR